MVTTVVHRFTDEETRKILAAAFEDSGVKNVQTTMIRIEISGSGTFNAVYQEDKG